MAKTPVQLGQRTKKLAASANPPWTNAELLQSVDTYVLLLRMQVQGIEGRPAHIAQALLSGPLALRNDAAIRYRMRNISAVAKELGGPTLIDFSPAQSVGSNVRPRIRAMLLGHVDFEHMLRPTLATREQDRQKALAALSVLRERVESLEQDLSWIGHNNPPQEFCASTIDGEEIRQALSSVDTISRELKNPHPDATVMGRASAQLIRFGATLAKWIGERTTKFIDAALLAAAPVAVAKVTGILPALLNAIESVSRVAGH